MDHLEQSRVAYGHSADRYFETIGANLSEHVETWGDLELLRGFVTERARGAVVLDAGCGTGRVAGFCRELGLEVVGIDIAHEMLEIGGREHPEVEFAVAELERLPFADQSFGSAVAWYSIITTPPSRIANVCTELRRVVMRGGSLLLGFQSGSGESVVRPRAYGTEVDLTLFRHDPVFVGAALQLAGFEVDLTVTRPPERGHEDGPQSFVMASC